MDVTGNPYRGAWTRWIQKGDWVGDQHRHFLPQLFGPFATSLFLFVPSEGIYIHPSIYSNKKRNWKRARVIFDFFIVLVLYTYTLAFPSLRHVRRTGQLIRKMLCVCGPSPSCCSFITLECSCRGISWNADVLRKHTRPTDRRTATHRQHACRLVACSILVWLCDQKNRFSLGIWCLGILPPLCSARKRERDKDRES